MILDVDKFISKEKPLWEELERTLDDIAAGSIERLSLERIKRLSYLQSKISEDLVRISSFSGEPELKHYLESLVARAYSITHSRARSIFPNLSFQQLIKKSLNWFLVTFPTVFRRNAASFAVSLGVTLFGVVFGGVAVMLGGDA